MSIRSVRSSSANWRSWLLVQLAQVGRQIDLVQQRRLGVGDVHAVSGISRLASPGRAIRAHARFFPAGLRRISAWFRNAPSAPGRVRTARWNLPDRPRPAPAGTTMASSSFSAPSKLRSSTAGWLFGRRRNDECSTGLTFGCADTAAHHSRSYGAAQASFVPAAPASIGQAQCTDKYLSHCAEPVTGMFTVARQMAPALQLDAAARPALRQAGHAPPARPGRPAGSAAIRSARTGPGWHPAPPDSRSRLAQQARGPGIDRGRPCRPAGTWPRAGRLRRPRSRSRPALSTSPRALASAPDQTRPRAISLHLGQRQLAARRHLAAVKSS